MGCRKTESLAAAHSRYFMHYRVLCVLFTAKVMLSAAIRICYTLAVILLIRNERQFILAEGGLGNISVGIRLRF